MLRICRVADESFKEEKETNRTKDGILCKIPITRTKLNLQANVKETDEIDIMPNVGNITLLSGRQQEKKKNNNRETDSHTLKLNEIINGH